MLHSPTLRRRFIDVAAVVSAVAAAVFAAAASSNARAADALLTRSRSDWLRREKPKIC